VRNRVELARRAFAGFEDRGAHEGLFTDDVEIVPLRAALDGSAYRGLEGVEQFWRDVEDAWSRLSAPVSEFEERGERVIAHGRLEGVARDTGIPVSMVLRWEIDFRGDQICRLVTITESE
jgi:ketosteroid isomerase-like protein